MKLMIKSIAATVAAGSLLASLAIPSLASTNTQTYRVNLLELNNSGVSGNVRFTLRNDQLTARVHAHGLEANQMHMQHIHGLDANINSTCPGIVADTNHDGIVSLVEGLPFYGPILLPLTPYPMANFAGNENFMNTFTVNSNDLMPLQNRVVVLHGMTINGAYDASVPVACGQITFSGSFGGDNNGNGNGSGGVVISGNGAGSRNTVNVHTSSSISVHQTNNADISNSISVHSSTGGNRANENTGGDVSINTGGANISIGVSNMANTNMLH